MTLSLTIGFTLRVGPNLREINSDTRIEISQTRKAMNVNELN
jgi:hypothetical protein